MNNHLERRALIAERSGDAKKRPIDYFYALFQLLYLFDVFQMGNRRLTDKFETHRSLGEMLRFFGIIFS